MLLLYTIRATASRTWARKGRARACRFKRDVRTIETEEKWQRAKQHCRNIYVYTCKRIALRWAWYYVLAVVHWVYEKARRASISRHSTVQKTYNSLFIGVQFAPKGFQASQPAFYSHMRNVFSAQITYISSINNRHFVSLSNRETRANVGICRCRSPPLIAYFIVNATDSCSFFFFLLFEFVWAQRRDKYGMRLCYHGEHTWIGKQGTCYSNVVGHFTLYCSKQMQWVNAKSKSCTLSHFFKRENSLKYLVAQFVNFNTVQNDHIVRFQRKKNVVTTKAWLCVTSCECNIYVCRMKWAIM